MRSINKVDYAGFTFAGVHSSQFGLYSVSSGNRYGRYLSPTIKNITAENTGGNGTYFFGSQYTQQTFSFSMAFDSVTELELREIKQWLSNGVSSLILDELPYIEYYAKVSSSPQMNFLVFDDYLEDTSTSIEDLYAPGAASDHRQLLPGTGRIRRKEHEVQKLQGRRQAPQLDVQIQQRVPALRREAAGGLNTCKKIKNRRGNCFTPIFFCRLNLEISRFCRVLKTRQARETVGKKQKMRPA